MGKLKYENNLVRLINALKYLKQDLTCLNKYWTKFIGEDIIHNTLCIRIP